MDCRAISTKKCACESLMSTVFALVIGGLVLGAVGAGYLYSTRSFVDLGNYMTMDGGARHALDVMSADIRRADGIISYSSNALTLKSGTIQLASPFDPTPRAIIRQ